MYACWLVGGLDGGKVMSAKASAAKAEAAELEGSVARLRAAKEVS